MVCPNCGADLSDSAKFCPKCGTQLNVAEEQHPDANFNSAGTEQRGTQPPTGQDVGESEEKSALKRHTGRIIAIIAAAVVVIAAVIVIIVVVGHGKSEKIIKSATVYYDDGTIAKYTFDSDGNVLTHIYYTSDGDISSQFEYDSNGNLLLMILYDSDGNTMDRMEITYDSDGNRLTESDDYNGSLSQFELYLLAPLSAEV